MATVPELMRAIETNGLAIAEAQTTVLSLGELVKKALQDAASGAATPAQLQEAITAIDKSTEIAVKTKESALQVVPTVTSPEPAPTPIPTPVPVTPPSTIDEIKINPAPEVGLEGTVSIDV